MSLFVSSPPSRCFARNTYIDVRESESHVPEPNTLVVEWRSGSSFDSLDLPMVFQFVDTGDEDGVSVRVLLHERLSTGFFHLPGSLLTYYVDSEHVYANITYSFAEPPFVSACIVEHAKRGGTRLLIGGMHRIEEEEGEEDGKEDGKEDGESTKH